MNLNIIDADFESCGLKEVTSSKIKEGGRLSKEGLFSQQIFGPLVSYHCACKKSSYRGKHSDEKTCPLCGVDIVSSSERKKRFAKICLPFDILNPMFYFILGSKPSIKKVITNLMYYKSKYYFDDEGFLIKISDDTTVPEDVEILEGINGIRIYVDKLIENNPKKEYKFIKNNIGSLFIKNIIVIPPSFRTYGISKQTNKPVADSINQLYQFLIIRSNLAKKIPIALDERSELYKCNFRYIQKAAIDVYEHVMERLSKKKGFIRSNILGKRIDFSGRAVISPDPTLKIHECRIPYVMALEIYKPQLSAFLINKKIYKRYNDAVFDIEEAVKNEDYKFYDIVEEFCKGKFIVLNRQPTLHRISMLGFHVNIHRGNTIKIPNMICNPFNADFDGDAMLCFIPITENSVKDVKEKLGVWANLISPSDANIVPEANQDIILGIYHITK